MRKYFGTDGIRGTANEYLTPELAYRLGRAVAYVLFELEQGEKVQILIGKDTRISGDMLEAALAAGICSAGGDVVSLGVIPTPGVAALCRHYQAAGAVISASHNPFQDNGIKFFFKEGFKLSDQLEEKIEYFIDNPGEIPAPTGGGVGRISQLADAGELYLQTIRAKLSPDLSGLKIAVDTANGAASGLAEQFLADLGAEVFALHNSPNGININHNCGSTHIGLLAKEVVKMKADLGIAFDGDADRMLAVDEAGQVVDGDQILAICAADLKEKGRLKNNTLVVTIMSNLGLTLAMKKLGIEVLHTKVGDRYVLEKMLEKEVSLGGEQSGHMIFLDYNTTGDGLVSALNLLSVIQEKGRSCGELARIMKVLPQVLINVPVSDKSGWDKDEDIMAAVAKVDCALKDRGRLIVRPSGTESLLRVMAEGDDEAELQELLAGVVKVIQEKRGR